MNIINKNASFHCTVPSVASVMATRYVAIGSSLPLSLTINSGLEAYRILFDLVLL